MFRKNDGTRISSDCNIKIPLINIHRDKPAAIRTIVLKQKYRSLL